MRLRFQKKKRIHRSRRPFPKTVAGERSFQRTDGQKLADPPFAVPGDVTHRAFIQDDWLKFALRMPPSPNDPAVAGLVEGGEEAPAIPFAVEAVADAFSALPRIARSGTSSAQEVEGGSEFFLSSS